MIRALEVRALPAGPGFLPAVPGQENAKRAFRRAIETGRMAHAYLFVGPERSGRRLFARELAKALFCREGFPCGDCGSCRAVDHDNHAGVTCYGVPEGKTVLDIDTVRGVCERTHYRSDDLQVAVLEGADLFTEPAANAVLKTLEEPPDGVLLILIARTAGVLPPTIVSRCHRIPFRRPELPHADLSREQLSVLQEVREPRFWARSDPREWLGRLFPESSGTKAALRVLLDGLISLLRTGLGAGGGAGLDAALALIEGLVELREDLDRNVQPELVLEQLVRRLRASPAAVIPGTPGGGYLG
jgi:hypothetical protein